MMPKKEGTFTMSWAKVCLDLPSVGTIPLSMDKTTFMPLLTCFHDAEKAIYALNNNCVTDESNPQLTPRSKMLLKLHFKLGHLGFQHLKFVIRQFKLFGAQGIQAIHPDTETPICSSCIEGGMKWRPAAKGIKKNTQVDDKKGILKCEKLERGERIFSDQYASPTVAGRNYNLRGQMQSTLSFKGGTIFCDCATGFIFLRHQVSFTGMETANSMMALEREASSLGFAIKGWHTDNGVYTSKAILDHLASNPDVSTFTSP